MNQEDFTKVLYSIPYLYLRKWKVEDIQMLFKILYWSALRPREGIRLKKEDFNTEDRVIDLGNTKTKTNDKAVIPLSFVDELKAYLDTKEDGRLFDGLKYNTFYYWLKKLGKMCDIKAWTVEQSETREKTVGHIFRKSIGKAMIYEEVLGIDGKKMEVSLISKLLRHSKPSITIDHYLKADLEQVKNNY